MYKHIFVPVDCSEDARRFAHRLAAFFGPMTSCRITLAAAMTPTDDPQMHTKRLRHAEGALNELHRLLLGYGIWTSIQVIEGEDHAAAFATAVHDARHTEMYDLVVLGTYQTRLEDLEAPCKGSLADRISQRLRVPVLILPQTSESYLK